MRSSAWLIVVLLIAPIAGSSFADAPPKSASATVIVVRHAEVEPDGTDDPSLGDVGRARAERLANQLGSARISEVWSSHLKRSRETAAPIARQAGVETRIHPARDVEALAGRLRAEARGTVVVVGHSNTVPELLTELGAADPPEIEHDEYDYVFVVPLENGRAGTMLVLRLDE